MPPAPKVPAGAAKPDRTKLGRGTVYFDNLVIAEFDINGNWLRNVLSLDFSSTQGWASWGHGTFTTASQGNCDTPYLHFTYYSCGRWDYDYEGYHVPIPGLRDFLANYYQNLLSAPCLLPCPSDSARFSH